MNNKIIPPILKKEISLALSYYPELDTIPIAFKLKANIKSATMLAQPVFKTLLRSKKQRCYRIYISKKFKIDGKEFKTTDLPHEVLTGWIGHELGHIIDYEQRGNINLIWYGITYMLSKRSKIEAEKRADIFAINSGMSEYLIKTKNFILNNVDIAEAYKKKIRKYYLSPEAILELVSEREKN